jgi:beta-lactam-binding protein with PASTA domain
MATVPNVVGLQIQGSAEAKDAVLAASLTLGTATGQGHTGTGAVLTQSPAAGATVAPGTAVDVTYSRDDTQGIIVWSN